MTSKPFDEMSSRERLDAIHKALAEVSRRLASGELDGSGRYYTDAQLAAHAAAAGVPPRAKPFADPAVTPEGQPSPISR